MTSHDPQACIDSLVYVMSQSGDQRRLGCSDFPHRLRKAASLMSEMAAPVSTSISMVRPSISTITSIGVDCLPDFGGERSFD